MLSSIGKCGDVALVAASESGCYMQQTSSLVMDKPDWLVVHAALPTRASLCCMFDKVTAVETIVVWQLVFMLVTGSAAW